MHLSATDNAAARAWRTRTTSWTQALRPRAPRSTSRPRALTPSSSGRSTHRPTSSHRVRARRSRSPYPPRRPRRSTASTTRRTAATSTPRRRPRRTRVHRQALGDLLARRRRRTRSTPATPRTARRSTASTTRRTAATSTRPPRPRRTASSPRSSGTYSLRRSRLQRLARPVAGADHRLPLLQQEERQPLLHGLRDREGQRAGEPLGNVRARWSGLLPRSLDRVDRFAEENGRPHGAPCSSTSGSDAEARPATDERTLRRVSRTGSRPVPMLE